MPKRGRGLARRLLRGEPIAVHGGGFIGTTTAVAYAQRGVRSVLYDPNPAKVALYRRGVCDVANLERWMMDRIAPYVESGMIQPTGDLGRALEARAHFVAVPTHDEATGSPRAGVVASVARTLREAGAGLVVVESTIAPTWVRELGLESGPFCVAPRRDWFSDPTRNIRTMPRVWAAAPAVRRDAREVLGIVCERLLEASSMRVACLGGKDVENAVLFLAAAAAQQLALAYDCDVNEALRLMATHPRLMPIYPSLRIAGYCVPQGAMHVVAGADRPGELTLFTAALDSNARAAAKVLASPFFRACRSAAVLGLTYRPDLKVATGMPLPEVRRRFARVGAHDPYFDADEIRALGLRPVAFPGGLRGHDAVLLLTDHAAYARAPYPDVAAALARGTRVFDNLGVWDRHAAELVRERGIRYWRFGRPPEGPGG